MRHSIRLLVILAYLPLDLVELTQTVAGRTAVDQLRRWGRGPSVQPGIPKPESYTVTAST